MIVDLPYEIATLDKARLESVAGVGFTDWQVEDMALAVSSFSYTTNLQREGAFFKTGEVRTHLETILRCAEKMKRLLSDADPSKAAAADMAGAEYFLPELTRMMERAEGWRERAEGSTKQGDRNPAQTESRKGFVRVVAHCWQAAGGKGTGVHKNTYPGRDDWGKMPELLIEICRQAGMEHRAPSLDQLVDDLMAMESYQDDAEVIWPATSPDSSRD